MMGADLLVHTQKLGERERKLAAQFSTNVRRANHMVNDLLDLARCNLGSGIPVHLEETDLIAVCSEVIEELTTAHPEAHIVFTDVSMVRGHYDPSRIAQVFSNLISNAVRHGNSQLPIYAS